MDIRLLSFLGLDKIDSNYQSTSTAKLILQRLLVNRDYALFLFYGNYLAVSKSTAIKMGVLRKRKGLHKNAAPF